MSLPTQNSRIGDLERIIARDVGRKIGPLTETARGGLARAAVALAESARPVVVVVTGVFVPGAQPPAAETDGPVGAAELAIGLQHGGARVRVLTDSFAEGAVRAALAAAAYDVPAPAIDVVPAGGRRHIRRLAATYRAAGVTHMIAVERIGPASDGRCYDMRGGDITDYNAPIHLGFESGPWATIGIGDGGNELGMGALPPGLVGATVEHGDLIRCAVPCDHLIVSGVSNWGAQALLIGMALVERSKAETLLRNLLPERDRLILEACVREGPAVDGVTRRQTCTVDGIEHAVHAEVLEAMLACAAP